MVAVWSMALTAGEDLGPVEVPMVMEHTVLLSSAAASSHKWLLSPSVTVATS